jgi:hypothetical protein
MNRPLQPHLQATRQYGLSQNPSQLKLRVNADQHEQAHSAMQPWCEKNAAPVLAA